MAVIFLFSVSGWFFRGHDARPLTHIYHQAGFKHRPSGRGYNRSRPRSFGAGLDRFDFFWDLILILQVSNCPDCHWHHRRRLVNSSGRKDDRERLERQSKAPIGPGQCNEKEPVFFRGGNKCSQSIFPSLVGGHRFGLSARGLQILWYSRDSCFLCRSHWSRFSLVRFDIRSGWKNSQVYQGKLIQIHHCCPRQPFGFLRREFSLQSAVVA